MSVQKGTLLDPSKLGINRDERLQRISPFSKELPFYLRKYNLEWTEQTGPPDHLQDLPALSCQGQPLLGHSS